MPKTVNADKPLRKRPEVWTGETLPIAMSCYEHYDNDGWCYHKDIPISVFGCVGRDDEDCPLNQKPRKRR